ncbi:sn-1-specific diacylglycerol lipase ABHD11 [Parasteatoda tepidariorum]|uniref:sn-1-specific diacylglycerol lipase ABHD11 n=1 Tax=Parasteatoda tepidariorum TaxID=114398 RepID=UPI001C71EA29|nr:protein ABHD11 [Parasteatoda tepidariorum]
MAGYKPVKIAYKAFEPAGGSNDALAPVIFLHGVICSKEMWDDIPQTIANKTKRKAYVYDARNHGESESSEHYNYDLNVEDLFHFMNGLDIKKAVLVGHSMGGLTATDSALKKPDRVEMVFSEDMFIKKIPAQIVDDAVKYITVWTEVVRNLPKDLKESDAYNQAVDILYEKNPGTEMFSPKEVLKKSKLLLKRKSDGGYDINFVKDPMLKSFRDPETLRTNPSGEFNGPAYFLYGGNSPFAVGNEESHIKKHFPKAELIEFEGASHSIHGEFPEKFVQTIVSRLQ